MQNAKAATPKHRETNKMTMKQEKTEGLLIINQCCYGNKQGNQELNTRGEHRNNRNT